MFEHIRLLVVDDHQDSQDLVVTLFETYGAKVKAASSVSEALMFLNSFEPNMLISDIVMPSLDGYTLIRHIRQQEADSNQVPLPAIALTAAAKPEDRDRALAAGFSEYIAKPVDLKQLIATVIKIANVNKLA
ncbi:MAG: response regulator [Jaaginema sp. PMC 1079.18]|nr:response regulator [Jaaginema sp. PMC 1080.18]MEC4850756.1 response regulator [Jaaginema sp. PMC 1079.18]MEC4865336.1 response regulator [Jaaginema sp. PMC 1078.18]